ncbi:MAG: VWA domain-containing protein [bacterium]|nr:VWA domain-containing protein [bacterium]
MQTAESALQSLSTRFYALVSPSLPNEWEVDAALSALDSLSPDQIDLVLAQVPAIWPVSQSLCLSYLDEAANILSCLPAEELPGWVQALLDQYESSGLRVAQRFMADVETHFLCRMRGEMGIRLSEVSGRLQPYAGALAGQEMPLLPLAEGESVYTDTHAVYLPEELNIFPTEQENALLYKLIISCQWGFIRVGTFTAAQASHIKEDTSDPLLTLFSSSNNPALQGSLYHFFETVRVFSLLYRELPGLMREACPLLPRLCNPKDPVEQHPLAWLQQGLTALRWHPDTDNAISRCAMDWLNRILARPEERNLSGSAAEELAPLVERRYPGCPPLPALLFQGELRWHEVAKAQNLRREQRAELFMSGLAAHLVQLPDFQKRLKKDDEEGSQQSGMQGQDTTLIRERPAGSEPQKQDAESVLYIQLDNQDIALPEELRQLAEEIRQDLGEIPAQYITSAAGQAGEGVAALLPGGQADEGEGFQGQLCYDEWDFRRKGYRRNWCLLSEVALPPVQSSFIPTTLEKYRGQIRKLRHQFELMQTSERFVRRQREGNDIDVDALVESLADTLAGRSASERLFVRLLRDERDIAVYFLVDMSNSTEGWVGKVIKETLVVLCEALQVLNDRYGIYGFSGMRRLRCELFPVKRMHEPYNDTVRRRIGAIGPREYTRMAPAIRHMTRLFKEVEAKIRLLVLLTDGKPEDYDDYKGEYAIEDTRHALLEARTAGIHPFCITVDRKGHEYMAHMCGENQYICIDSIKRLPSRMPQIYRSLTT